MISMAPTARRTTMVQVAGTAGGVGTTTVAALIFAALSQDVLGAPQLYDHAAGELGLRLPEGDDVRLVNPGLGLHDCGAHAAAAVGRLADPHTVLVLVTAATPAGCAAADRVLDEIADPVDDANRTRPAAAGFGVTGAASIPRLLSWAANSRIGRKFDSFQPEEMSKTPHWSEI
jgi:hypothetical protein